MSNREMIMAYFEAEERGDVEAVLKLCSDTVVVRNAAQPVQHGHGGVRDYVTSFRDRTSRRTFNVRVIAQEGDVAFAWWSAWLTFRTGITFGPVVTRRPFDLKLEGVIRFHFDSEGRADEIDVCHETTTVFKLAKEAAEVPSAVL